MATRSRCPATVHEPHPSDARRELYPAAERITRKYIRKAGPIQKGSRKKREKFLHWPSARVARARIYTPWWQEPTIHPPIFFSRIAYRSDPHTHAGEREKDDPRGDEREKDDLPHTRARLHDVWSSIPDTRRYINVERKSVGPRKKAPESEKDGKRKEKRDGMWREKNREQFRRVDKDRDRLSKGVEYESEKNAKMHVTRVHGVAIRQGPNEPRGVGYVPWWKEKPRKRNSDARRERRTRQYKDGERRGEGRDESDECGRRLRE